MIAGGMGIGALSPMRARATPTMVGITDLLDDTFVLLGRAPLAPLISILTGRPLAFTKASTYTFERSPFLLLLEEGFLPRFNAGLIMRFLASIQSMGRVIAVEAGMSAKTNIYPLLGHEQSLVGLLSLVKYSID